jgi:Co/Zn/Cd efflux system component
MVDVQTRILGVAGVTAVHDLHVWAVSSGMVAMSGHAIVPDLGHHPEVLERIRAELCRLGIGHVTIQLEVQHECEEPRAIASSAAGSPPSHLGHRH